MVCQSFLVHAYDFVLPTPEIGGNDFFDHEDQISPHQRLLLFGGVEEVGEVAEDKSAALNVRLQRIEDPAGFARLLEFNRNLHALDDRGSALAGVAGKP